jgi:hypothetical protein
MKTILSANLLSVTIAFLLPFGARAVPGDEHWDNQFNWPGPGGTVYGIAANNGQLYVGAAGISVTNILLEAWDGLQWSTLAQVYSSPTGVNDMAFVGGTLYVAGNFTNVSGVNITGLAKWDGANWSSIGFSGTAYTLAVNGDNLYVGGIFTNPVAGGAMATNIAYWDGSTWHALGNGLGISSANSSAVLAIALQGGLVYAGGLFTNSGSLSVTNLAVWNGSAWSAVGGGANSLVEALAFNGADLWVGGTFTQVGSTPANYIAQWDGANWSVPAGGMVGSVVFRLAVLNGSVYAGGTFTSAGGVGATNLAAWNGSSWSPLGAGVSASVTRLVSTGTNILVGGNFLLAGGIIANGLAAWDGAHWSTLGTPGRMNGVGGPVISIGGSGTNLLIGGSSFLAAGQTGAVCIARFDGANFYPIGPGLNSNVVAVAAVGTSYYAGGLFSGNGSGYGPLALHMAHWDGTNWSSLNNTAFATVNQLATAGSNLFIAGYFDIAAANGDASWLARWDGTNFWSVINALAPIVTIASIADDNIGFSAMAIQGTNLYASGQLRLNNCAYALYYDGNYGWPMGSGLNTNATAIAILGTNVYFSGPYVTNAGGVTVSQIARWNGNNWTDVGGGVVGTGSINALAVVGTNLYAGGGFTNIGGVAATRIAMWNGQAWSPLGSGVSPTVEALYTSGSDLYVGGYLRQAGNQPSYYLARWNDQINFNTPQISPLSDLNGQFQLRLTGTAGFTNIIQATTNLSAWTPILTNSAGLYNFTDPASPNYPSRFYRAMLGP